MKNQVRFTDSNKWTNDDRFINLTTEQKLFWLYINDRCDQAGLWAEDFEQVKSHTGIDFDPDTLLEAFEGEIINLPEKKSWWLKDYCTSQFKAFLQEDEISAPRKYAVNLLKKNGLYDAYVEHYKSSLTGT